MQIERRKFITSACKACLLAGAGILITDLIACSPSAKITRLPVNGNAVSLPLTLFTSAPIQIVRPEGWIYDIAVRKISADQYEAIFLQCTHQQNQLLVNSNGYTCTLHGSRFNLEGEVEKGPAEIPLKRFATTVNQAQLIIQLKS